MCRHCRPDGRRHLAGLQVPAIVPRQTGWYAIRHDTCWSSTGATQDSGSRGRIAVTRRYGEGFIINIMRNSDSLCDQDLVAEVWAVTEGDEEIACCIKSSIFILHTAARLLSTKERRKRKFLFPHVARTRKAPHESSRLHQSVRCLAMQPCPCWSIESNAGQTEPILEPQKYHIACRLVPL